GSGRLAESRRASRGDREATARRAAYATGCRGQRITAANRVDRAAGEGRETGGTGDGRAARAGQCRAGRPATGSDRDRPCQAAAGDRVTGRVLDLDDRLG